MKPGPLCHLCPLNTAPGPVWGEGSPHAKLVIIGMCPGPTEIQEHRPFVGGSGTVLDMNLRHEGVSREGSFVTNVVKCFVPPGQPLPPGAVKCCKPLLDKEMASVPNHTTILALGQEATHALSGKHVQLRHNRKAAEKNKDVWLRGCPLPLGGEKVLIPTLHPSFIMRTGFQATPVFQRDIRKAGRFANGLARLPRDRFLDNLSDGEVLRYINELVDRGEGGIDIETPELGIDDDELDPLIQIPIELVGISHTDGESIAIRPDQFHLLERALFVPRNNPPILWAHNGYGFDFHHLGKKFGSLQGVRPADSMLAFYMLWSHMGTFDIATMQSFYTDIPYYKNTRKLNPEFYNTVGNTRDTFGAMVGGHNMLLELREMGSEDEFWRKMRTDKVVQTWRKIGINTDRVESDKQQFMLLKTLQGYITWWEKNMPLVDWASPKQLVQLFQSMGMVVPMRKREKKNKDGNKVRTTTPSVDDEALEEIIKKYPQKCQIAKLIQVMRGLKKSSEFYDHAKEDGRIHARFKMHAQVGGRIQANDGNVQTFPEDGYADTHPRAIIVGDYFTTAFHVKKDEPFISYNDVIITADFSQVELRAYVWYTKAKNLLDKLNSGDYIHGVFYEEIWKEPFFEAGKTRSKDHKLSTVPPWKLLVAKSWPLGFIYGRGIPDGTGLPLDRNTPKRLHDTFHADNPEISRFHNELMFRATRYGYITTVFGAIRKFPNPKLARNEILSFPGQGTVVSILEENAIIPLGENLQSLFQHEGRAARLLFTVHDSVAVSCPPKHANDCHDYIVEQMEKPVALMDGMKFPVEAKIGPNWYKGWSREKFNALVRGTTDNVQGHSEGQAAKQG